MYNASILASKKFGRILDESILSYKKSDKIFILGSGPSINLLNNSFFDYVKTCDSIGFNYWLCHDFVPTYFMFQLPPDNYKAMLELFSDRSDAYSNVPFIIRGSSFAKGNIDFSDKRLSSLSSRNPYFLNEFSISSRCNIDINMLIDYAYVLGFLEFGKIGRLIPKWRGTLGLLITLSYLMGYKEIVLCGMDMYNNKHFWDDKSYSHIQDKYAIPDDANIKSMTDTRVSTNTVPQYVYALANWMNAKSNVKITLAHSQSVLYPNIPLFSFK